MKILFIVIILFAMSMPIYAVNGYVSIEYDFSNSTYLTEVDLNRTINDCTIGLNMKTELCGITLKNDWLPAGQPKNQTYTGYIRYKIKDITFTLKSHCLHFFSRSGKSQLNDISGITLKAKYEF